MAAGTSLGSITPATENSRGNGRSVSTASPSGATGQPACAATTPALPGAALTYATRSTNPLASRSRSVSSAATAASTDSASPTSTAGDAVGSSDVDVSRPNPPQAVIVSATTSQASTERYRRWLSAVTSPVLDPRLGSRLRLAAGSSGLETNRGTRRCVRRAIPASPEVPQDACGRGLRT